jgi:predicted dehydrogenase
MADPLRWGILGTANIARAVVNGIRMSSNGTVAAVASRDSARAEAWAQTHAIPKSFGSYDALIHSGEVDAIYVPLPNSMHAEWTIRCLRAGIPVLCEKPFARSASEAREVQRVAQETGIPVAEAFMYRFHPLYDQLVGLLLQGVIGNLVSIRSAFSFHLRDRNEIPASAELAGGALMDVGCYCVNFARLITGTEPDGAVALERRSCVDDTLAGVLRFPDRVLAQVDCSIEAYDRAQAEIVGSDGVIVLEDPWFPGEERGQILLRRSAKEERITTPGGNGYHLEVEDFVEAVRTGRPPRWTVEDAVANMAVIDALLNAARTGSPTAVE